MRVLVTGGGGFVGRHVIARLRGSGHEPIVFDRHGLAGEEMCLGDVRDAVAVDAAVADCEGVIHLAALLGTQETMVGPEICVAVNIQGSINVFKAVRRYGVPAVYIAVGNHWMNNPYSITKTTAERFALMFRTELGAKIAVVRGFNAYGPGQKAQPIRKMIPNFILPALRDEELIVYGDGSQIMDMIWVEDVADILVRALEYRGDAILEAGTGRQTTVQEIAELVVRVVGGGTIRHAEMRPGEPENSVVLADPSTLAPLGTFDFLSLEEGLRRTIPYYARQVKVGHLV